MAEGAGRWLVTGGSGRVGRMLRRAMAADARCLWQTRGSAGSGDLVWDILAEPLPLAAWGGACLIAFAGVTPATGTPLDGNAALAEASLAAAHGAGIRRVLLASSSSVYGLPERAGPVHEDDALRPVNAYGASKVAMEALCAPWRARGVEVCVLRIGNVAGADVLLLNGRTARAEAPLRIDRFADGGAPLRSYIGPETLARVLATLADLPGALPEVLNIAAPQPVSMAALADAADMPRVDVPAPPTAIQAITLDVARLQALHRFDAADSAPAEMIRQWRLQRDTE